MRPVFRYILPAFMALAALSVAFSCKKKSTDDTKKFLNGSLSLNDYPYYIETGDEVEINFSGVTHPDGKKLGLTCSLSAGGWTLNDTICDVNKNPYTGKASRKYVFPDTLGLESVTVRGVVLPEDASVYYSSSTAVYVTLVDRYLSIPETAVLPSEKNLYTDKRDGEAYRVVQCGDTQWMGNNLCYAGTPTEPVGIPYYGSECMNPIVGRYYTWNEAMDACPVEDGWRLPSEQDWIKLASFVKPDGCFEKYSEWPDVAAPLLVDAYFNGSKKMWEYWPSMPVPKDCGQSVLRVLPMGFLNTAVMNGFKGVFDYACFWTSELNEEDTAQAFYRYIYKKDNSIKIERADKNGVSMTVRCVRNLN